MFPFSASALDDPSPWDYADQVRDAALGARSALDLGTGGGERLAAMRALLPPRVVATEAWPPNVTVARAQLKPLGIDVVWYSPTALPFKDQVFDLVLSRHEEVTPSEVGRVLAPAGRFVTQQVGRSNWREIHEHFERATRWEDHLSRYSSELRGLGLEVESQEHGRRVAYPSLADFVFLLTAAPWTVPDFDVRGDFDALRSLESAQLGSQGLALTEHRYLLIARKPG